MRYGISAGCRDGMEDRFSPMSAVHVANALIHAVDEDDETPRKLDVRYLDRLRMKQRLGAWQELADEMTAATA